MITKVEPIHGWGWSCGDETLAVPRPFEMQAHLTGPPEWAGKILSPEHTYAGCAVKLSQRHSEWDGQVNVEILREGLLGAIHGFATIAA